MRLVSSAEFDRYRAKLRETWPPNDELTDKHGVAAGNGHSEIEMSETQTGETDAQSGELYDTTGPEAIESKSDPEGWTPTRRQMMVATGVAAATLATSGIASASPNAALNWNSDLTPNARVVGSWTLDDHELGNGALSYVDDSGDSASLADYGGVVADRADEDDPHNPIRYRADYLDAEEFHEFPRGEYIESGDDEDDPLSALDAEHWTEVDGEISVDSTRPASGGDGLEIVADGVSGEAVATFDDFEISSGERRKFLQVGVNVVDLADGASVEFRVVDDAGNEAVALIDETESADDNYVISTYEGHGVVYQQQLGDLEADLDTIESFEIAAVDGDATIEVFALNLDRESEWDFGTREVLDSDDEIETETVREPAGEIEITSVDSIGDEFSDGTISEIDVDAELRSSHGPSSWIDHRETDPSNPAYDARLEMIQSIEIPSAYDLSPDDLELVVETRLPGQYLDVESATGLEDAKDLEDVGDLDTEDHTSIVDGGDQGDEHEVGSVSSGETVAVYTNADVIDDQHDEITDTSGVAGGPLGGSGEGFLSTPMGIASMIATGVVTYLGIARGWIGRVLPF